MASSSHSSFSYAGTFQRVMDAKNRVTIPSSWLAHGVTEFHAIASPSGECLMVMPPEEFHSIEEKIRQSSASPAEQRQAIRQFYGKAHALSADKSGRILLPEEQCKALSLQGSLALVGGRSRFEVWNSERWAAISEEEETALANVATLIGL